MSLLLDMHNLRHYVIKGTRDGNKNNLEYLIPIVNEKKKRRQ